MMKQFIRVAMIVIALSFAACSKEDIEARARDAADKNKASIPDVEAHALDQKAAPADVKAAQEALSKLNEYQGEINGTIDSVTVSAIQAFQRSQKLEPDGILTEPVRKALREAAAHASKPG